MEKIDQEKMTHEMDAKIVLEDIVRAHGISESRVPWVTASMDDSGYGGICNRELFSGVEAICCGVGFRFPRIIKTSPTFSPGGKCLVYLPSGYTGFRGLENDAVLT